MRLLAFLALWLSLASPGAAADLYKDSTWPALAADRRAAAVGDMLTVLIVANSSASNSVAKGTKRNREIGGRASLSDTVDEGGSISLGASYDGQGTTARSDRMAAQLSARVDKVLPNGDLAISGWQVLRINGETTNIKISGRVRPADLDGQNMVLSTRIADASIDYDGRGFASRSAKPGIVSRMFNFLGLM